MDGLAHRLGALKNAGIGQCAVACHEAADHQRAPYAMRNLPGRCAGQERLLQWREWRSHRRTMPLKMTDRIRRMLAAGIGWVTIKRRNGSIVSCWENPLRRLALGSPGVTTSRALSAMGTSLAHGGGELLGKTGAHGAPTEGAKFDRRPDTLATTWHCCCDSDHKNAHPPANCRNCAGAAMLFHT